LLVLTTLLMPAIHLVAASRPTHVGAIKAMLLTVSSSVRVAPRHILVKPGPAANIPAFLSHARKYGLRKHGRVYGSSWYTIAVGSSSWLHQRSTFSSYAPAGEVPDNGLDDDGDGRIDEVVDDAFTVADLLLITGKATGSINF